MLERRSDMAHVPPCLILAHANTDFATAAAQGLRRLGWDVYVAHQGSELRRLAGMLEPAVILIGTELPDESGWLTCDKLTAEMPQVRILLLADAPDCRFERFAAFVGASALIDRSAGVPALLEVVSTPPALPVAG